VRSRALGLTIGVLPMIMASALLVSVGLGRAEAVSCPLNGYLVESSDATQQWGARASSVLATDSFPNCSVIRTVYVEYDYLNFVEIGWYDDGPSWSDKCDDVSVPHVLVYASVNGFKKCRPGTPALSTGQRYSFRVDNPDHDGDFVYYWDSDTTPDILLGYYNVDRTHGFPRGAAERKDQVGTLRASLLGMNSLGGGGSWHAFPDPAVPYTVPPVSGWTLCDWSNDSLEVRASGSC
jgi:hypothetical protein